MYTLRQDQIALNAGIHKMWDQNLRNVVAVGPTGFGKTVTASHVVAEKSRLRWQVMIVAHRQELIEQWAMALARSAVPHTFIAQPATIKSATDRQREELGHSFYKPTASVVVASVDTLVRKNMGALRDRLDLWICDEAHHCAGDNKWMRSVDQFPNAYGLGLTATPERADGKGLGRHASGVFNALVTGPSLRECINMQELTDYEVMCPPNDVDLSGVNIGKEGDYTDQGLSVAMDKSSVYGDVVQHYIDHAYGRTTLNFGVDIKACHKMAQDYRARGVPALALSAKNTSRERAQALRALANRELWVISNCDLFSEGFDAPAIEVVQDVQPTRSYPRFAQKFGRMLRVMPGNPGKVAMYMDHVGNVEYHRLPDNRKSWSLDNADRRERNNTSEVPVRICGQEGCHHAYEATLPACPYCGWRPTVESASRELEQIQGSLVALTDDQLDHLRGEIQRIDRTPDEVRDALLHGGMGDRASYGAAAQHRRRSEAQLELRQWLQKWSGLMRHLGCGEIEQHLLSARFGTNVLYAQTLGRPAAEELTAKIRDDIEAHIGSTTYKQEAAL